MKKSSKQLFEELEKNIKIECEVLDGTKVERTFFTITEDDLINVFNVLPTDSLEEAKKKIMAIASTDEFLYAKFNKNPEIWEIKEFLPGCYTVPVKEEKILSRKDLKNLGYTDEEIKKMRLPAKTATLTKTYQQKLSVKFVKRTNKNVYDDIYIKDFQEKFITQLRESFLKEGIIKNLTREKFASKAKIKPQKYNDELLMIIPDVELHLGKLGSKFDSTDSYDYKKALYRYVKIINDCVEIQKMYKPKEVIMTVGNDFYNTDNVMETTSAGTEQNNDTRFQQMIINGIEAHVWAIEKMKENCNKIILKFHPGNHDYLIDFTLYQHLFDLYKDDPKVEISNLVKDLRFTTSFNWKGNLAIFTHGKTPDGKSLNDDSLSTLRDKYFQEEARKADYSIVFAGHLHNSTENNFSKKITSKTGVTVVRSGSPSGDGAWEAGNLYSADKQHNVYFLRANRGLYSTVNVQLIKDELEDNLTMAKVNDESDVKKDVRESLQKSSEKQYLAKLKKEKKSNDAEYEKIEKNYDKKIKDILVILGINLQAEDLTEEQKSNILTIMGYDEEVKPLLDKEEELSRNNLLRKKLKEEN